MNEVDSVIRPSPDSTNSEVDYESPDLYKLMIESVRDYAIFMLDPAGNVRSWNLGAERSKGYTADEIVGHHFSKFYTREDRVVGLPGRLLEEARLQGRVEHEGWRVRKDGSLFWADVILTPVFDENKRLTGFAKVTRDVTEKRQLLKEAEEALRASQAKSAFLANMSHELRTPLTAIIGYAELLEEEFRAAKKPDWVADISRIIYSGNHLLSIVSDVLDLSRVEAGKLELNVEQVNLRDVLHEVAYNAESLAAMNGNVISVEVAESTGKVWTDRKRLRQVLYNLIANASKFTSNGSIRVSASSAPGAEAAQAVQMQVSDTGIGMDQEELTRIFDKFYQVESQVHPASQGGTGLGLAISRMLCEAMGGKISVKSTRGEGSTFQVYLPRVKNVSAA